MAITLGKRPGNGINRAVQTTNGMITTKPVIAPVVVTSTGPSRMGTSRGVLDNTTGVNVKNYTLDNSAGGATVNYVIGDSLNEANILAAKSAVNPTACGNGTVAADKERYGWRPMQCSTIQFQTSSNSNQFNQTVQYISVNDNGDYNVNRIILSPYASASDYNPLIRSADVRNFVVPVVLGLESGLFIPVIAGQIVTVNIEPAARVAQ